MKIDGVDVEVGDRVLYIPRLPWYVRLWHFITRRKAESGVYTVTEVSEE